jgi:biotin transport system substrate-specific component
MFQLKRTAFSVRGITYSALFSALFVVLSSVSVPVGLSPVPITLQNFALMLTGALLGAGYGFFAITAVVVLTALGLPLLHGAGGLSLVLGPTGGFIWMFPFSALLIGWVSTRIKSRGLVSFVLLFVTMFVFGSVLLYVSGVPWLAHVAHISLAKALVLGCYPYLPGDLIKAFVASLVVVSIRNLNLMPSLSGKHDHVVPLD